MSVFIGLVLMTQAVGAVPQRSPELDAANDCLVANTQRWLDDKNAAPDADKRWRWASIVVGRCEAKLEASLAAAPAKDEVGDELRKQGAIINGVSRKQMLRSEALYYVDSMIRDHFENSE
ncbi:MAG: hypothetical protein ABJP70_03420 [Erythrobacter sp.]